MIEELQRRNFAETTIRSYVHGVEHFSRYFHRRPDQLGPEHIRHYQAMLFSKLKYSPNTVTLRLASLRFFYIQVLKRSWSIAETPYPKKVIRLPQILTPEEVAQLIDAAELPFYRILLMTMYGTGARRSEVAHLKVGDIDSGRMVIHIHGGKGNRDRDVMLSQKLLGALREYWRGLRRKPNEWLFPGNRWHTGNQPITTKVLWTACEHAAQRAGLTHRRIYPHLLRQAWAYYTTFQSPFILKTIGLDRRGFAEVYGRHDVPLSLPVAPLEVTDPFSRSSMARIAQSAAPEACAVE
jgi:site-specific recombinase XerD